MWDDILTFRPYVPADLHEMQATRRSAFEPVFNSFRTLVGEEIATHAFAHADEEQGKLLTDICKRGSDHHVIVAMNGSTLVGFCSYKLDPKARLGEIGLNAVHPRYAGQGIGTRMYEHVLARMREEGMLVAAVSTGGDSSHAAARRAYAKAGFSEHLSSIHLYRVL
jgi:GNAT superfamily N-acetyltransferase